VSGASGTPDYIVSENITCAFGVPGNISHGFVSDGVVEIPVVAVVAKGL
jgi:hypothetical protein